MPTGLTTSTSAAPLPESSTAQEYAAAVAWCASQGQKIVDYGIAHSGLGHAPPARHVRITAPTQGFEHWKSDLSARVPGGMTIGQLQQRLAEANQWLPIDADDDLTVAEVIAHDVSGPLRLTHGTCRDLLLGLRYVDATGTLITVGGRTVKNVAGYDVTRLMVGSLNTLGLIADANLRTSAIPSQVTRIELHGLSPAELDPLMTALLTSDASPLYLEAQVRGGERMIQIGYSGTPRGCEAQQQALMEWLRANGLRPTSSQRLDSDLAAERQTHRRHRAWRRSAAAHAKLIVPPARTGSIMDALRQLEVPPYYIDALPTHGVLHIGTDWSVDEACAADEHIERILKEVGGMRLWHRRPGDTNRIAPFAPPQPDWSMLHRIKQTLDPQDLFNPGRIRYTG